MTDHTGFLDGISKEKFRQTMNKLLNECFILKKGADTDADYRFIISNRDAFERVLDLLGYELQIRDDQGVIAIFNPNGTGRIHFSKFESIIVLILRLLYIEKVKALSQTDDVIVLIEELYDKYNMLKIGRPRKDQLINSLRSFKRVNLIHNLDRLDTGDMDIRIKIYPSILFAVTSASLEEMYAVARDKLNEYGKGEDNGDDESADEEIN